MTKDEIQTRLESAEKQMIGLQDEIANLKAKLDEAQDDEIPEFPVFERGEDYWYLDIDGCIERNYSDGATENNDFNMFHNDKYAKLYADKCRELAMLLHCKWHLEEKYRKNGEAIAFNGYDIVSLSKTVDGNGNLGDYEYYAGSCHPCAEVPFVTFANHEDAQKAAAWMNAHAKRGANDDEETA